MRKLESGASRSGKYIYIYGFYNWNIILTMQMRMEG